jgi:hypothetical protein
MPVPRPMEQYTFPGAEIAGVSGMVAPGEYYGWTPSQVITNVPQMAQGLAQMGATSIPRPPEDGMVGQYRPGQASAALATPRMYDFPLSAAQKELAASQQSRAGVGMTGQAVREREALARDAARIAENRAWLEQRQLAPIREQGEQARLTQKAMTERQLAVEQAKAESRANLLALETPQERIAARRDVIKQLMQDKDIAFKQDDRDKVIQADKDIQMAETAQAMDELKAKNQFNADQQARSFVQQARLQAQREGIDLTKSVLGLLDNPLMDQDIKAQIMSKGLENLIAEPKPIEPPTAPTGQMKAEEGLGDQNQDGQYSIEEQEYDQLASAYDSEPSPARKIRIKQAMDVLKKKITTPQR